MPRAYDRSPHCSLIGRAEGAGPAQARPIVAMALAGYIAIMTVLEHPSDPLTRAVSPLREVWTIAWPTVLTMTSYTAMQFTDKLMVGQVGPTQLAAQTNGGIWSFALLSFVLGVLTVVNTYVSQNLGVGTPRNGPKYAWAAFWLGLIMWVVVMLPYALLLPAIFGSLLPRVFNMHGHSPELLQMEVGFAQILVLGSIFLMISRGLNQFFFGLHRPRIVTIAAISGVALGGGAEFALCADYRIIAEDGRIGGGV